MNAVAQTRQTMRRILGHIPQYGDVRACMAVDMQCHGGLAHITLSGYFGLQMNQKFIKSYRPLIDSAAVHEICVDMTRVDYLDSSALGMLLLLNERAKVSNKPVTLIVASGVALRVLKIANFGKMFNIKHVTPQNFYPTGVPASIDRILVES